MRHAILGLSSATFGLLGGCMTLAGALLPLLLEDLGIGLMDAGSMLALQPFGFLLAVGMAQPAIRRFGLGSVLAGGILLAAAGFGGFGLVSSWRQGAAAMLVAGTGVGMAEVTTNAVVVSVAGQAGSRVLNFVHLFFGVGSFVTPLLATYGIEAGGSWRLAFLASATATALVGLGWMLVPGRADAMPLVDERGGGRPVEPRVNMLAVLLGLYVGVEMGVGGWLSKFLVAERGLSLSHAGRVLSAYWFAVALGRLWLSLMPSPTRSFAEERRLAQLSGLATGALALAIAIPNDMAMALGFFACGLGFSGIFPGVVALGGRYQPTEISLATGRIITGAGVGNVVIPWVMSAVAERCGLPAGMWLYATMSLAMWILSLTTWRLAARAAAAPG